MAQRSTTELSSILSLRSELTNLVKLVPKMPILTYGICVYCVGRVLPRTDLFNRFNKALPITKGAIHR